VRESGFSFLHLFEPSFEDLDSLEVVRAHHDGSGRAVLEGAVTQLVPTHEIQKGLSDREDARGLGQSKRRAALFILGGAERWVDAKEALDSHCLAHVGDNFVPLVLEYRSVKLK